MEDSNVACRGIVHELLTKDNYKKWKTLMKNYLQGEDLWSVVEYDCDYQRGKNAKALHIIKLSCGSMIFDEISECENAKDAWDLLDKRYGLGLNARLDIKQDVVKDDTLSEHGELYKFVEKGNSNGIKTDIKRNKCELDKVSDSGWTILHVATMAGHVNVVQVLVIEGGDNLVTKKDNWDYTALALAAHYTGNKAVAKCMVENKDGKVVHEELLGIPIKNVNGTATKTEIPLLLAADKGHKEMTRYLYHITPKNVLYGPDSGNRAVLLFQRCIKAEIFDVALNILDYEQKKLQDQQQLQPLDEQLATKSLADGSFPTALHHLAQTLSAFYSSCRFGILRKIIYHILPLKLGKNIQIIISGDQERHKTEEEGNEIESSGDQGRHNTGWFCGRVLNFLHMPVKLLGITETYEQKRTHDQVKHILNHWQHSSKLDKTSVYDAMLLAAKHGNVGFIEHMTEAKPGLLWVKDSHDRGIFSHAILNRKDKVFQLIHTLNGRKDKLKSDKDVFGNNLLHLAGHLGHSSDLNDRPGAALKMQREIQWFKAVEKIVHPKCKEEKNVDDKKPHEVFTEKHEELVKEGEKWAKDIAKSFIIVGTLIITVIFAAAFTVPGGNDQNTGEPILSRKAEFSTFLIADVVSFFTSSTSVLIFIWILTSRFDERDFLTSLPWKLLVGLVFLFFSVVSMLITFGAVIYMVAMKSERLHRWVITVVIIFGCIIMVVVLVLSQLKLIFYIIRSTISNPIGYVKKKKQ